MRILINTAARRNRLLALAVGAIPLSLCASASAGTYWTDAGTVTWLNSGDWTSNWPDGALWPQAAGRNAGANLVTLAPAPPSYGQRANAVSSAASPATVRDLPSEIITRAIASPALTLYSWDAALADPAPGTVLIKVDNTPGDADFGDVILEGNAATLYTLVIQSFSGSMNSGRYDSLHNQYAGGGGSEAATLQGLAVDNTTNHSGFFAVFSQTSSKINEAGLGVTLDFTGNAQSVDLSTLKNGKSLFSGTTDDLMFEWSSNYGLLVSGLVEYSSTYYPTPSPPTNPAYWKSSVANGNWSTGSNWSSTSASGTDNAGAPGSISNALIVHSDNINRVVTLDENSTVGSLQIGNGGGGTDTLSQTSALSLSTTTETLGVG
jgi:hypothetical protein